MPHNDSLRSPVRPPIEPQSPSSHTPHAEASQSEPTESPASSHDPHGALNSLRLKMESIADEFAQGKLNLAQFQALYKRYHEQRTIIEKLLQRNPESDAWQKVVGTKGATTFLRQRFEAQTLCYAVFRNGSSDAIITDAKNENELNLLKEVVQKLWRMPNRPHVGVARKYLSSKQWLLVAIGAHAATLAIYSLEPSNAQARLIRDLHADFERANQAALARGWVVLDRMVFPQRALTEGSL